MTAPFFLGLCKRGACGVTFDMRARKQHQDGIRTIVLVALPGFQFQCLRKILFTVCPPRPPSRGRGPSPHLLVHLCIWRHLPFFCFYINRVTSSGSQPLDCFGLGVDQKSAGLCGGVGLPFPHTRLPIPRDVHCGGRRGQAVHVRAAPARGLAHLLSKLSGWKFWVNGLFSIWIANVPRRTWLATYICSKILQVGIFFSANRLSGIVANNSRINTFLYFFDDRTFYWFVSNLKFLSSNCFLNKLTRQSCSTI